MFAAACEDSNIPSKLLLHFWKQTLLYFHRWIILAIIPFNIFNPTNILGTQYIRKDICCSCSALSSYQYGHNLLKAQVDT